MDAIGALSFDDFRIAARFLVDRWTTVINPDNEQPPWTWITPKSASSASHDGEDGGYLALEKYIFPFQHSQVQEHCAALHYYDFHIVYSDSFRVPVLYFRAYTDDGSPLCMDDIEKDFPPLYAKQLSDSEWTFITQEEHPYLNRPWYKLHPCGTSEWMKLLYDSDSSLVDRNRIGTELYLMLWLSVVGPMVGLKIPIKARKQLIDEALLFKS